MKKINKKLLICLIISGCVLLTGCSSNGGSDDSDSASASQEEATPSSFDESDIQGTWELSSGDVYLTFNEGQVLYSKYSGESIEATASGAYTVESSGEISVNISDGLYNVSIESSGSLVLTNADSTDEGTLDLAGSYNKSSLPSSVSPSDDAVTPDETNTDESAEVESASSDGSRDENLASFLAENTFTAATDTFLGSTYENGVSGSFIVKDSDYVEGTFYVTVEGSSAGSLNYYFEGNTLYCSNSTFGTTASYSYTVTDSSIIISQIDTDAEGEDLLNTISGTWYAD